MKKHKFNIFPEMSGEEWKRILQYPNLANLFWDGGEYGKHHLCSFLPKDCSDKHLSLLNNNSLSIRWYQERSGEFFYGYAIPSTENGYWFFRITTAVAAGAEEYNPRPMFAPAYLWILNSKFRISEMHISLEEVPPVPLSYELDIDARRTKKRTKTNVYFIQAIIGGPVKIGHSYSPAHRLKEFQRGSPFELRVVRVIPDCSIYLEEKLHRHFARFRLHGEWFDEAVLHQEVPDWAYAPAAAIDVIRSNPLLSMTPNA